MILREKRLAIIDPAMASDAAFWAHFHGLMEARRRRGEVECPYVAAGFVVSLSSGKMGSWG
jgi:hypothetical protein